MPFELVKYKKSGHISFSGSEWQLNDTLHYRKDKTFFSRTILTQKDISRVNYTDSTVLDTIDYKNYCTFILSTARYSPYYLLQFLDVNSDWVQLKEGQNEIVVANFGEYQVSAYILSGSTKVDSIKIRYHDDLWGDTESVFQYDYTSSNNALSPVSVLLSKYNGAWTDTITITRSRVEELLASDTQDYPKTFIAHKAPALPELSWSTYSDGIHLLELKHTDDRVLVAEFDSFVLVAEAPLNSENGHLIIDEVNKRIGKPIRFFVYGHFHPHYLGGVRAFVNEGAKIICSDPSKEYARRIIEQEHSIKPDSLYYSEKPLKQIVLSDSFVVSDGEMKMVIYFIGEESAHTCDYLIYYFPHQKLLFEDDLVWIKVGQNTAKAGARQKGLYQAIQNRGLDVETIIQSWPVKNHSVKTIINIAELESTL